MDTNPLLVTRIASLQCPLSGIGSLETLASLLECRSVELYKALGPEAYSTRADINKPDRVIYRPNKSLKAIQKRLYLLLSLLPRPDYLFSAKRRSWVSNAGLHAPSPYLAKMDIRRFFEASNPKYVTRFFQTTLGISDAPARLLTSLVTVNGRLPRGAPTSSILAYWAYQGMFDTVDHLAKQNQLRFSLFVDDMVFSGDRWIGGAFYKQVQAIVRRYGHSLKPQKFVPYGPNEVKIVTGCALVNNKLRIPNRKRLEIVGLLQRANAMNSPIRRDLRTLMNKIAAARQIESGAFQASLERLKAADRVLAGGK
jgi:hypothetical protein